MFSTEIVKKVANGYKPAFRPTIDRVTCSQEMMTLITNCWKEDATIRPDYSQLRGTMRKLNKWDCYIKDKIARCIYYHAKPPKEQGKSINLCNVCFTIICSKDVDSNDITFAYLPLKLDFVSKSPITIREWMCNVFILPTYTS